MGIDNATRFISAYNKIDKTLRNTYKHKANVPFSEMVRKCALLSVVVRKFDDILIDYSRLRNAIVHSSDGGRIIAEPVIDAVEQIEYIAKVLSSPPKAANFAHEAVSVDSDASLKNAVLLMTKSGYSNVPVMKDCVLCGVLTNKHVVEKIAQLIEKEYDLQAMLDVITVNETMTYYKDHYCVVEESITIDAVLNLFSQRRKLQIIILTSNGRPDGDIIGVLTTGDILALKEEIENY